jgi:purine-binding chemotaxis protein CheW
MRGEDILEAARDRKKSTQIEMRHRDMLKVSLNKEWYGINIENVTEVRKCPKVFSIPHTPDYVMGVVNLRGEILAVVDIRKLLNLSNPSLDTGKYIVVVERDNVRVGIMVDKASDVVSVPDSAIESTLSSADRSGSFIMGEAQLDGEVLSVLDLGALMEEPEDS